MRHGSRFRTTHHREVFLRALGIITKRTVKCKNEEATRQQGSLFFKGE